MPELLPIEKDVPISKVLVTGAGKLAIYPFRMMEVGDSFLIEQPGKTACQLSGSANKRFAPKRFTTRKLSDGSRRIWRIE